MRGAAWHDEASMGSKVWSGRALGCAGLSLSLLACGSSTFTVGRSPDFPASRAAVSIFGFFRDGKQVPELSQKLVHVLEPVFGDTRCLPAYASSLVETNVPLQSAVAARRQR